MTHQTMTGRTRPTKTTRRRSLQLTIEGLEERLVLDGSLDGLNFFTGGSGSYSNFNPSPSSSYGSYGGADYGNYVGGYGNLGSLGTTQDLFNSPYPSFPDGSNPYPTFPGSLSSSGPSGTGYTGYGAGQFFSDLGSSLYDSVANSGAYLQAGFGIGSVGTGFQASVNTNGQVSAGTQYLTVNENDNASAGYTGFVPVYGPFGVYGGTTFDPSTGEPTFNVGVGVGTPNAYGYVAAGVPGGTLVNSASNYLSDLGVSAADYLGLNPYNSDTFIFGNNSSGYGSGSSGYAPFGYGSYSYGSSSFSSSNYDPYSSGGGSSLFFNENAQP